MPDAETFLEVSAALILRDGKVLVARRKEGPMAGLWEFPGGKVESGETPEQALIREIQEELDLVILPFQFLCHGFGPCRPEPIRLWGFLCSLIAGEPVLRDHDALKWVTPEQLIFLEMPEADRPLQKSAYEYLS